MTKEELIKIFSAYLPYDLDVCTSYGSPKLNNPKKMFGADIDRIKRNKNLSFIMKPILYDLSYLTKEIEHNGEFFEPMEKMHKDWDCEAEIQFLYALSDDWASAEDKLQFAPYSIFQKLLAWHFNVFGLEENEFINKANLKPE
ncbi:hypothetical protein [Chryseobacterium sp.]|uniref:hypothetical protein n=1 Tax=Chryseobacterium sp. TaxID=1871047 RepID=UPI00289FB44C|nr:hypothetical protein [Chryseobacterium sp.]